LVALYRIGFEGGTPGVIARSGTLTNPVPLSDGSIYARHQSLSQPPEIVRIDGADGSINRVAVVSLAR
jgi:hypothetical protein